jgi:hypothetical protein
LIGPKSSRLRSPAGLAIYEQRHFGRSAETSMSDSNIQRVLGGSPGSVLAKLVFLSILVGAFLSLFGLTPPDIIQGIRRIIDSIADLGFGAVREIFRYFVYGAVIVVPLWLLSRLFGR